MITANFFQNYRVVNLVNGVQLVSNRVERPFWDKCSDGIFAVSGIANVYNHAQRLVAENVEVMVPVDKIVYCEQ